MISLFQSLFQIFSVFISNQQIYHRFKKHIFQVCMYTMSLTTVSMETGASKSSDWLIYLECGTSFRPYCVSPHETSCYISNYTVLTDFWGTTVCVKVPCRWAGSVPVCMSADRRPSPHYVSQYPEDSAPKRLSCDAPLSRTQHTQHTRSPTDAYAHKNHNTVSVWLHATSDLLKCFCGRTRHWI